MVLAILIVFYVGGKLLNYSLFRYNFEIKLPYPYRITSKHILNAENGDSLDFDRYYYFFSGQLDNFVDAMDFYENTFNNSTIQGRMDYFKNKLNDKNERKIDGFLAEQKIYFNNYEYYQVINNQSGSCALLLVDSDKKNIDIFHFYVLP